MKEAKVYIIYKLLDSELTMPQTFNSKLKAKQ